MKADESRTPESESTPGVVPWPNPISETGRYGLAGDFIRLVSPQTEGDPNAILMAFLTYSGNVIGRNFYLMTGADVHCGNLFLCIVGHTGQGRKGSGMSVAESFFRRGPAPPKLGHVLSGVSTGEGVIWQIHDAVYKDVVDKRTGKPELTLIEPDVPDKRLLINLSEFQQCLASMRRQESILPTVLRQGWDKDILSAPAKNSPAKATGALLSVVAGISRDELLEQTGAADAENGTLNRFLFACSRRSKLLPEGGEFFELIKTPAWEDLQERFNHNVENEGPLCIKRDVEAQENWGLNNYPNRGMYKTLNEARTGLWGAVTARAPQQVLRVALITAVINGYREIRHEHLDAAYEIWRYSDESAKHIFGDKLDDPTAGDIMNALRSIQPGGLARNQIYRIWKGHKERHQIDRALLWLSHTGIARCERIDTGGRPSETWFAV